MEPRKSIRDITSSNIISDMVDEQPVIKRTKKISDMIEQPNEEMPAAPEPKQKKIKSPALIARRIRNTIGQIKPAYLVGLVLIIALALVLVLVPSPSSKDPIEQAKVEAEVVKKQLSKHMILPENEEIDIRKITSKLEDPFFQNAEIGDYLIIFYKNRIAYIYSVEKDIIVNAGVVFIDPKTATTTDKAVAQ